MSSESGGFGPQDRETLITVKVRLETLTETVQGALLRIGKLEEGRITSRDIEELMADTDTLRAEKVELERRVATLETWRTYLLGVAAGAGALVGGLVTLLFRIFWK